MRDFVVFSEEHTSILFFLCGEAKHYHPRLAFPFSHERRSLYFIWCGRPSTTHPRLDPIVSSQPVYSGQTQRTYPVRAFAGLEMLDGKHC